MKLQREGLFILVVAFLSIVPRLFYLDVPFERDEGVYAYISDVMDRGGIPYLDAFDHKPPGIFFLYNLSFKLFGHCISSPRILAAISVMAACALVLFFVYRITSSLAAASIASLFLGISSASPAYAGFNANSELFTLPFLLGALILLTADDPPPMSYFWGGIFSGTALMIKQSTAPIAFALIAVSLARFVRMPRKCVAPLFLVILGGALPYLAFVGYFAANNGLAPFWEGFYSYNVGYVSRLSLAESYGFFLSRFSRILMIDPILWLAGSAGLLIFVLVTNKRKERWLILALLAGAWASVAMGTYYHNHYFLFLVPFLAAGVGLGAGILSALSRKGVVTAVSLLLLTVTLGLNLKYYSMSHLELIRESYYGKLMPFYQAVSLGRWLRDDVGGKGGTAFTIGAEPEILFYSGLKSVSRFIFFEHVSYPTKLRDAFREELLTGLQKSMPDYLLIVNSQFSKLISNDPFTYRLLALFADYRLMAVSNYYKDMALTDNNSLTQHSLLNSPLSILVFKRGDSSSIPAELRFGSLYKL
jgi:4-amino-4-deoxy-L-arabinose transferase-like glycosyltransferase